MGDESGGRLAGWVPAGCCLGRLFSLDGGQLSACRLTAWGHHSPLGLGVAGHGLWDCPLGTGLLGVMAGD